MRHSIMKNNYLYIAQYVSLYVLHISLTILYQQLAGLEDHHQLYGHQ